MIKLRSEERHTFHAVLRTWLPTGPFTDRAADEFSRQKQRLAADPDAPQVYEAAPQPRLTLDLPTHEGIWMVRPTGEPPTVVVRVWKHEDGKLWFGWRWGE